jgi:Fe-S-cluster containining protein
MPPDNAGTPSATPQAHAEFLTANVELSVGGQSGVVTLNVPTAPTTATRMLPVLQHLADAFVELAARGAEQRAERVSCAKGCGACCRQLVPVTRIEAQHVARLIHDLPADRRSDVEARFHRARERLAAHGLLDRLRGREASTREARRELAVAYFRLGIPCPFLDDESCSIHANRPVACREYLVTSDPAHCTALSAQAIRIVDMALKVSHALVDLGPPPDADTGVFVPLVLAPEWAAAHAEEGPAVPGPQLLRRVFNHLSAQLEHRRQADDSTHADA